MATLLLTFLRFIRAIWHGLKDPEFQALFTLTAMILLAGMFFYHGVEGWSWLDALYFSVTTLTTVGFGDLTPHTSIGKIFTIVYIFVGIGVILGFINAVASKARTADERIFRHDKKEDTAIKNETERN